MPNAEDEVKLCVCECLPSLLKTAKEIAEDAHKNQFDKGGSPYFEHPLTVCNTIVKGTETEPLKTILANLSEEFRLKAGIVALLHDVPEDTEFSADYLEKNYNFPCECMCALRCITKAKNMRYESYLSVVRRNKLASVVKLADLLHNSDLSRIACPTDADVARTAKYQAAIQYLSSFCCESCGETLPLYFMSATSTPSGETLCDVCNAEYKMLHDGAESKFEDI
ncbi:MAG: hypothetical protein RR085_09560 [Clostridia bacterium]